MVKTYAEIDFLDGLSKLKYPVFLLVIGESRAPGTEDGDDRIMLLLFMGRVQECKHLTIEKFSLIENST